MAKQQKILVVDDTPENIQILVETLKDDYQVVAATNGYKALQLAVKIPLPDIILLDVMMPGIDGYEVCARLKSDTNTRNIPVIFITALAEAGDEAKGLGLGAVDYMTKPINPSLLKARVHNQLELKKHRDNLQELVEKESIQVHFLTNCNLFFLISHKLLNQDYYQKIDYILQILLIFQ